MSLNFPEFVLAVYWIAVLTKINNPICMACKETMPPAFGTSKNAGGCPGKHGGAGFLSQSCFKQMFFSQLKSAQVKLFSIVAREMG